MNEHFFSLVTRAKRSYQVLLKQKPEPRSEVGRHLGRAARAHNAADKRCELLQQTLSQIGKKYGFTQKIPALSQQKIGVEKAVHLAFEEGSNRSNFISKMFRPVAQRAVCQIIQDIQFYKNKMKSTFNLSNDK